MKASQVKCKLSILSSGYFGMFVKSSRVNLLKVL